MSLPAISHFAQADGALSVTDWFTPFGTAQVISQTLFANAPPVMGYWAPDNLTADQYSELVALGTTGINGGPTARSGSTGGGQAYAIIAQGSGVAARILLCTITGGGTVTILQNVAVTPAANDVLRLRVVGTTLQMLQNGVQIGTDQTDASIASGQPGFYLDSPSGNNWDNWVGDNVAAATNQIAYPIADISAGSWTPSTGTDLYAMIDETVATDTDYDQSGVSPSNDTMEVQLTSLSTPSTGDVTFTVRHRIH